MATDYKKIAKEHEKRYGWDAKPRRIYKRLYSDKTHFIYELIQNADDSGSANLELQLNEKELLVWNDGRQFNEKDVRSICSLGSSDKDLTDIGTFGIGFKAVYNYTDSPEIYSGNEHFRIRDFVKPEGIDEMTPEIEELVNAGKTVFRLPFKGRRHQADDIGYLKDRLCNLSKERSLLFLRNLKRVEWKNEHNAQTGSYACHRHPYDKIQNVSENESVELVDLIASLDGSNRSSKTFLVFCRKVHPPKVVIDKLLEQAEYEEDGEEQQRIQQSAEELQSIEAAFKLQDDGITAMNDNCVLFAYLPTEKETHLKFLIQARYQTTPARDNIPKPSENPWNEWLVQETANFLPEILEQLKTSGLLEPAFFNVLPLKGEVENDFKPIADASREAMKNRSLVPTQDGGYAKAENVFYPENTPLRELVRSSGMYSDSSLLHPDIQNNEKFRRCFKVMRDAGVEVIGVSRVLSWLEEQSVKWFEDRSNEWLCSLYAYLKEQKSQLERIKKLPLVRLENGQHVCASNELVFFPPETDEAHEAIRPFLNDLPILQSILLEAEDHDDIKLFLDRVDVKALHPEKLIREWMIPQYSQSDKPSETANLSHVRYLFKVWNKLSGNQHRNLRKEISETPILWAYNGDQPETFDFVKPCDVYLPKAYTGNADLETYFSVYNGDIWFVDDGYLDGNFNLKEWFKFLKAIEAMDTPQVIKKNIPADGRNTQEFDKELDSRNIRQWKRSTRLLRTNIEDFYLHGLSELLVEISKDQKVNLSQALWCLLIKVLPSEQKKRDSFFQGTYHWFYYNNISDPFDAEFYRQLKETPWLHDDQGNPRLPSECFVPASENRKVLGDSVAYLHSDFDVSQDNESAQWLAKKLGIHLNANTDSVLNYLQTLSGTEACVKKVEPLYHFLERQGARPHEEFKENPLIFTSNPEPSWWRTDKVFWKDESKLFKNNRGYLKLQYREILKPFFMALGVSEQASQLDYARGIQEIATTERAREEEVRERVKRLYTTLTSWQADEWKIIYNRRCWLGKRGDEWKFFSRNELVRNDHPYIADIFEGQVPFWTFDDLLELTKYLEVESCSQAKVEFHPEGDQEKDTDLSIKVRKLHPYIHAFLNSPRLYEASAESKSTDVLNLLSVRFVEKLKTTYTLKEISLTSPNPRPSFLEVTNQEGTLWLALEADKDDYASLISDALQDYFGAKDLGRFTEHLLSKKDRDKVLNNWKREGLRTELCVSLLQTGAKEGEDKCSEYIDQELPDEHRDGGTNAVMNGANAEIPITNETPETGDEDNDLVTDKADKSEVHPVSDEGNDSRTGEPEIEIPVYSEAIEIDKSNDSSTADESENPTNSVSDIRGISSPDTQSSTNTNNKTPQNVNRESESEVPTVHEDPETGNESVTSTYQSRPSGSGTRPRSGKAINTPSGNRGTGYSSSRSGDTGGETHIEATDTSPHARKEIENIGMEHARRHEEEEGCTVEDVSAENLGYDLRSTTPDGEIRCIEVKARADRAPVVLTSNEWSVAEQLQDDYFLYVVLNAATQPELYIIQNPTDKVAVDERYDVRYHVPLSEITEHGIPV